MLLKKKSVIRLNKTLIFPATGSQRTDGICQRQVLVIHLSGNSAGCRRRARPGVGPELARTRSPFRLPRELSEELTACTHLNSSACGPPSTCGFPECAVFFLKYILPSLFCLIFSPCSAYPFISPGHRQKAVFPACPPYPVLLAVTLISGSSICLAPRV